MKQKLISLALALALALTLVPSAFALGSFPDVTDAATAQNVEVLRLMGVIEGDNGMFRPERSLTRAEFCKMAVVLSGKRSVVARYGSRTVFPDVKASHWAAGYINYAASKDVGMVHGMPDGTFLPNRAISYGEAVAILMRQLGYTDADTGGIWPDGYLALAKEAGMTKGLNISGNAEITRAQAVKLFVNALSSENDEGKTLLTALGYTANLTEDSVTLWSIDTAKGVMHTSGDDPDMLNPLDSSALIGLKGWIVMKDKKAVTFLPETSTSGNAVSDAAIIVSANGSTAGFDALTGRASNCAVYRNGVRTTVSALKKNDVVTYNAANNTLQACDTRVGVYYENCEPSPNAPTTITALGGTTFDVLPSAQSSLSQYRPGKTMTLLLTADGRVAGATDSGSNAYAFVDGKGKVSLICAGNLIPLNCSGSGYEGEVVRIAQNGKDASQIYLSKQSGRAETLDLNTMTLGSRKLADGALVFSDGKHTTLAALGVSRVDQSRIAYARINSANEVDLIVIKDSVSELFGRVVVSNRQGEWVWNDGYGEKETKVSGTNGYYETPGDDDTWIWNAGHGPELTPKNSTTGDYSQIITTTLQRPNQADISIDSDYSVRTGDFVSTGLNSGKSNFINITRLTNLASVPASAWIGDTAVNYGGRTYTVYPNSVMCWNRDAGNWFDDLDAAKKYGGTMDLYVKDGVVRAIEVRR